MIYTLFKTGKPDSQTGCLATVGGGNLQIQRISLLSKREYGHEFYNERGQSLKK